MPKIRMDVNARDSNGCSSRDERCSGSSGNIKRDTVSIPSLALGCVFCKTGHEEAAARLLNTTPLMHHAFVPKKVEHRSEKGIRSTTQKALFPGYVFFQAEPDWCPPLLMYHVDYIHRILMKDGSWHLHGDDAQLVEWLMEHDGLLGMSKAYTEGTRVIIKSGPLKELEGIITKVDRHNRNGMVTLDLFGRKTNVWLPFDFVDVEAIEPAEVSTNDE